MPIRGKKKRFTNTNISTSPIDGGVYALFKQNEVVYIGKGDGSNGIKGRLQSHRRGDSGCALKSTTSFKTERCQDASKREKQLLEQHLSHKGRLPRYNKRIG
jgi:hypothetical protein